jgi:hypothetical protein
MHLPAASPPLRGALLLVLSRLTALPLVRNLMVAKVRRDARIPALPEVP